MTESTKRTGFAWACVDPMENAPESVKAEYQRINAECTEKTNMLVSMAKMLCRANGETPTNDRINALIDAARDEVRAFVAQ